MTTKMRALAHAGLIGAVLCALSSPTFASNIMFFESPSAKGTSPWNSVENIATRNAWRAAVGETPDFGEDWDGNDWTGDPWENNQLFDVQDIPTAIFVDGVSFSNVGADANRHAESDDAPGSTRAIDELAWQGHESGESTIFFPNLVDYLGFFTFDTDSEVSYHIRFSNGDTEWIDGKETDEDLYRFVGFVNTHPTAQISRFSMVAEDGSRYGIDELEWGRKNTVPEPATLWLLSTGVGLLLYGRRRRRF